MKHKIRNKKQILEQQLNKLKELKPSLIKQPTNPKETMFLYFRTKTLETIVQKYTEIKKEMESFGYFSVINPPKMIDYILTDFLRVNGLNENFIELIDEDFINSDMHLVLWAFEYEKIIELLELGLKETIDYISVMQEFWYLQNKHIESRDVLLDKSSFIIYQITEVKNSTFSAMVFNLDNQNKVSQYKITLTVSNGILSSNTFMDLDFLTEELSNLYPESFL